VASLKAIKENTNCLLKLYIQLHMLIYIHTYILIIECTQPNSVIHVNVFTLVFRSQI